MKNVQKMLCALFMGLMFVGGNLGAMEGANDDMQDENMPESRKRKADGPLVEKQKKKRRKVGENSPIEEMRKEQHEKFLQIREKQGSERNRLDLGVIPMANVLANLEANPREIVPVVNPIVSVPVDKPIVSVPVVQLEGGLANGPDKILEKKEEVKEQEPLVASGAPGNPGNPGNNPVTPSNSKKPGVSAVRDKTCCISLKTVIGVLLVGLGFLGANKACSFSGKGICKDILRVQNQSLWKAGTFGFSSLCLAIPGIWLLLPDKIKFLSKTETFMLFMGFLGVAVPLMLFYLQK